MKNIYNSKTHRNDNILNNKSFKLYKSKTTVQRK